MLYITRTLCGCLSCPLQELFFLPQIHYIGQVFDFIGPVNGRSMSIDTCMMLSCKCFDKSNRNMVKVDKNGNIIDIHSFGANMGKHLINNHYKGKRVTLNMPRHCFQNHLDKLEARDKDVEKAVGHVINDVAERYYKTNNHYIERLKPFIERMEKEIENAYRNAK